MKNTLNYKGFLGSVHLSEEDEMFYGKLEGISDCIMFEGASVTELKSMFKEAVNEYIEDCKHQNKPCFKSFKGSFNVRVKPEMHKRAVLFAIENGISLNQLIQKAIEREIEAA
jgi:predicted HicB family RNase H-like nuclease